MSRYDAIIIGGGHNGLVCAAYLAKAGRKVCVLERRHLVGGAAVTEELYPGFKYTVASYVVSLLRPWIWRDLELAKHGLELIPLECSYTPHPDGPGLCRWPDPHRTREEISRFSRNDAEKYPEFGRSMGKLARFAKEIIDNPPPEPASLAPRDLMQMMGLGKRFRDLGDDLAELQLKISTMSATDFLDEWFEADALKAPMSCSGIIGTFLGVRSPGTAYVLLHHYMGEIDGNSRAWGFARGGNGAVSEAIASSARAHGAEIRCNASVKQVTTKAGRANGVVLEDGSTLEAKVVISSCEPKLTFLKLVGEDLLPDEFVTDVKRYRCRGSSGKVNLALDSFPDFTGRPGDGLHMRGDIAIALSSIEYLETAPTTRRSTASFSHASVHQHRVIPSLTRPDRSRLPASTSSPASCSTRRTTSKEGAENWPAHVAMRSGTRSIDTLEEYITQAASDSILFTARCSRPWDLEQEFGLSEGNIFHGELSLEQLLFQRPTAGWARYRTPLRGLWLCGSGAHPGGGVMGAPGGLCALEMLRQGAI